MTNDDSTFLFSWLLSISIPFVAWTISLLHWFGGTPFQGKKKEFAFLFSLSIVAGVKFWS